MKTAFSILFIPLVMLLAGCGAAYYAAKPSEEKNEWTDLGMMISPVAWVVPSPIIEALPSDNLHPNYFQIVKDRHELARERGTSRPSKALKDLPYAFQRIFDNWTLRGKTQQEVINLIGPPDETIIQDQSTILVYENPLDGTRFTSSPINKSP